MINLDVCQVFVLHHFPGLFQDNILIFKDTILTHMQRIHQKNNVLGGILVPGKSVCMH